MLHWKHTESVVCRNVKVPLFFLANGLLVLNILQKRREERQKLGKKRGKNSLKLCHASSEAGCKGEPKNLLLSAGSLSVLGQGHSRSFSASL